MGVPLTKYPPQVLEALNELYLLVRQHPGEDLAAVDDPLEQLRVLGEN